MSNEPVRHSGLINIRVSSARGLTLPSSVPVPTAVQRVLDSQQGQAAASVSPSSVTQARLKHGRNSSIQRQLCLWIPYLVMEFDVNQVRFDCPHPISFVNSPQVLIDAVGGTIENPVWMYEAHLYV